MVGIDKYKKDKILIGVIDKKRTRSPEDEYKISFLIERLKEEVEEIEPYIDEIKQLEEDIHSYRHDRIYKNDIHFLSAESYIDLLHELADISNFCDFIFNALQIREKECDWIRRKGV